eukprot:TRINITY_DN537_c0_g4_i2.p4 TRINITY_DN537_c0_g4~~TRINITY_DN537_c0_g4_i2.p4  ORF type:complete len:117 (-),score=5.57 TRINITY_DN537_c0_g4_i2:149-499(-)
MSAYGVYSKGGCMRVCFCLSLRVSFEIKYIRVFFMGVHKALSANISEQIKDGDSDEFGCVFLELFVENFFMNMVKIKQLRTLTIFLSGGYMFVCYKVCVVGLDFVCFGAIILLMQD